jgi:hypothetical protein
VLWQAPPPAPPPPLAFRTATLHRGAHSIDVEILATANVPVRVTISRHGLRLGRDGGVVDRGSTVVRVRIGPKSLKPLRKGLHVAVAIEYGAREPLHARPALKLAPRSADDTKPLVI